jgi:hypothetical protein
MITSPSKGKPWPRRCQRHRLVNSRRPQAVVRGLAIAAEHRPRSCRRSGDAKFEDWTGQSQSAGDSLTNEGSMRARPEERQKRRGSAAAGGNHSARASSAPVPQDRGAGPGRQGARRPPLQSLRLRQMGQGLQPVVGWHRFSERSKSAHPLAGDFSRSAPRGPRWELRHVGHHRLRRGRQLSWETVEAGGPSSGADWMQKAVAPVIRWIRGTQRKS